MTHVLWAPRVALGPVVVDGPEGRHGADVRRLRPGEPVQLVDGEGTRGDATVTAVSRGALTVTVSRVSVEPRPEPWITVVQGLAKGERAELAVELCSEVGVDEVLPWQASRSITRWNADKAARGVERWRAIAREAGKQSRRARFCEVGPLLDQAGLLERVAAARLAVVLEATAPVPLADLAVPDNVLLIVGPEGGIDPEELSRLEQAGAVGARLGPSVLRTSGAGAVAAAVLLSRTGRWRGPLT